MISLRRLTTRAATRLLTTSTTNTNLAAQAASNDSLKAEHGLAFIPDDHEAQWRGPVEATPLVRK